REDRRLEAQERGAAIALDEAHDVRLRAAPAEGGLERERLAHVEGVGALHVAEGGEQIGRVDAAHQAQLVAQRLAEEALLDAAVAPPRVELVLDGLVDALPVRWARV